MQEQICEVSGRKFTISDRDLEFYKKMGVPLPRLCPEERQRRRISFRNFKNLYRRKCDASGKQIISMYHGNQPFPVYSNDFWWSDNWDPLQYGKSIDFSRPVFEQYEELANQVPRFSNFNLLCENTDYSNFSWSSRNCYYVFGCVRDEDCLYGHIVWDSKNCLDNLYIFRCELCSNCIDCVDSFSLHFSTECSNCSDSYFLHDCQGCSSCFLSTNLRNKKYYFCNEKYSKEEYLKKVSEYLPLTHKKIKELEFNLGKLKEKCNYPPFFGVKNEDVSGNHLYECKNCEKSFDAKKSEDSKFLYTSYEQINSYDISFTGVRTDFCLDSLTMGRSENCMFCHLANNSYNALYSEFCFSSHDLFLCNGLRNQEYCIFNKKYSKEEYLALKEKLIEHMKKTGEWGEFFPIKMSPFGYNEAIVNEYLPLKKEEALSKGYKWRDKENPIPDIRRIIPAERLPNKIEDIPDDVLNWAIRCEKTGRPYKIQKSELSFYRKLNLPIPHLHPDERHKERMNKRNPRKLWDRNCNKCNKQIQTTFSPARLEKVLCEECYLEEVY